MAMMKLRAILLACMAATGLAGCASPYRDAGGGDGFTEEKLAEDRYLLTFQGSGPITVDAMWCLWVYHGAQMALRNRFDAMTIARASDADTHPIPTYGARGNVQMVRLASLPSNVAALDATALVRMLDGFVRSGGRAMPPARMDVVKAAAVFGRGSAQASNATTMDDLKKLLPRAE